MTQQDNDRAAFEAQIELPPLPSPFATWKDPTPTASGLVREPDCDVFAVAADQMQDYARAAIAQDPQSRQAVADAFERDHKKAVRAIEVTGIPEIQGLSPENAISTLAYMLNRQSRGEPVGHEYDDPPEPSGYAYRYRDYSGGTFLRLNHGGEVNGSKPVEAVPFWFNPQPTSPTVKDSLTAAEPCPDCTLPYEQALSSLIDKIIPGLDSGDLLADAQTASAALTVEPVLIKKLINDEYAEKLASDKPAEPVQDMPPGAVCKGSVRLGSGCRGCERCFAEIDSMVRAMNAEPVNEKTSLGKALDGIDSYFASKEAAEPVHCPTDVCQAARFDGILCANDECDRANGVRPAEPVRELSGLEALFVEALAWGRTYGPALNSHQWGTMRDEKARDLLASYGNVAQPTNTPPVGALNPELTLKGLIHKIEVAGNPNQGAVPWFMCSLLRQALPHLRMLDAQPAVSAEPIELQGIADAVGNSDGVWRSCSGCHELNEGHDTGPYSNTLKCHLGNGCSECGGIGAIWDTTDYQAMADEMAHDMPTPVAAQSSVSRVEADSTPPYSNCSFRLCDLPGQCRSEGECHHPTAAPEQAPAEQEK